MHVACVPLTGQVRTITVSPQWSYSANGNNYMSRVVRKPAFCICENKDWNDLPESLISSSELSDDSVSKFTSLVRARD